MLRKFNMERIILIESDDRRNKDAILIAYDQPTNIYSFDVFTDESNDIDQETIKTYKNHKFLSQNFKKVFKIYDVDTGDSYDFEPGAKYFYNWDEYSGPKEILYNILANRFIK